MELRLVGEVDGSGAAAFGEELRLAAARERHVLLDLRACEFLDSAALAAILLVRSSLAGQGLRLGGFGATGQVRRLIEVTELCGALAIAQDRGEAVSRLLEAGAPALRPASSDAPTP